MVITGRVSDKSDNSAISGATIKVYYKPYENGVYTSAYSFLTSTTTDASGNYTFDQEKPNTSDFKFIIEATNYFAVEKVINPDNISLSETNTLNFTPDPSSLVNFHFKNNSPYDADDNLQFVTFGLNPACATCCTNDARNFPGTSVDATFSCTRYAKRYLKYQYFVTKAGFTQSYMDSIYCTFGTPVTLEILY